MVGPRLARIYGTLAGLGFIGLALLVLPSTRLLDPPPEPEAYLLTLLAVVTGLACIAVPWDRLDPRWLHAIGIVATVEVAATVAVFGQRYVALFFLIAILVAYMAPDARQFGVQLGFLCLAVFAPVLYGPENARSSLAVALVVAPVVVLTAIPFSYLRLKTVHDRQAYHRFAEQTLVLSSQLSGRRTGPVGVVPPADPPPSLARVQLPATAIAIGAVVLGLPLGAGGLAVAGVTLPDVVSAQFERLGIELPNQQIEELKPVRAQAGGGGRRAAAAPDSASKRRSGDRAASRDPRPEPRAPGSDGPPAVSAPPVDSPTAPVTDEPGGGAPDPPVSGTPDPAEDVPPDSPLGELLDEATKGIDGLVDDIRAGSG